MKKEWIIIGLVVAYIVLKNRSASAAAQPNAFQRFIANLNLPGSA